MESEDLESYRELFKESASVRHKCAPVPEMHRFHIHQQLEMVFPLSENLCCNLAGTVIDAPSHAFFLINNSDLHMFTRREGSEGELDRYVIFFRPEYVTDFLTGSGVGIDPLACFFALQDDRHRIVPVGDDLEYALQLLARLAERQQRLDEPRYADELAQLVEFSSLLTLVCQRFEELYTLEEADESYRLVCEIVEYIHERYAEPLRGEQIAREFLIGKSQLYDLFRRTIGISPHDLIVQCRMSKAVDLLSKGLPVAQVGEQVGYGNLSHFSQVFKQYMGCSPKQFQKSLRERDEDECCAMHMNE